MQGVAGMLSHVARAVSAFAKAAHSTALLAIWDSCGWRQKPEQLVKPLGQVWPQVTVGGSNSVEPAIQEWQSLSDAPMLGAKHGTAKCESW